MNSRPADYRCGYVAILGRPNVGKSTLLNHILGQKLSITSRKPQTTRHRLLGIKTTEAAQAVYVDTPGLHLAAGRAINRYMNRAADSAIFDVDVIVFMVEALRWTAEDDNVLQRLQQGRAPVILAPNKVDRVARKQELLPYLEQVSAKASFAEIYPLSALRDQNVQALENGVVELLPRAAPLFSGDQISDRSERFFAAEIIREKLMRRLGQELPYRSSVEIEAFSESKDLVAIDAVIWVERAGQKAMVIGKGGATLKALGSDARKDLERFLDRKVFLRTWVKVRAGWSDDESALKRMGYDLP